MRTDTLSPLRLTDELLRLEDRLAEYGRQFGFRVRRTPVGLHGHLQSNVPVTRLAAIRQALLNQIKSLEICEQTDVDPWDEREFFHISMQAMGICYPLDFLKIMEKTDLVEAYDGERLQIFRNLRFMETSSYSLIEVSSQEWPVMFRRSSTITDEIIGWTDEKLWDRNAVSPFAVRQHYIEEINAHPPQVVSVQFKYIAPLFLGPNKPFGFACTCSARIVDPDSSDSNLAFI